MISGSSMICPEWQQTPPVECSFCLPRARCWSRPHCCAVTIGWCQPCREACNLGSCFRTKPIWCGNASNMFALQKKRLNKAKTEKDKWTVSDPKLLNITKCESIGIYLQPTWGFISSKPPSFSVSTGKETIQCVAHEVGWVYRAGQFSRFNAHF